MGKADGIYFKRCSSEPWNIKHTKNERERERIDRQYNQIKETQEECFGFIRNDKEKRKTYNLINHFRNSEQVIYFLIHRKIYKKNNLKQKEIGVDLKMSSKADTVVKTAMSTKRSTKHVEDPKRALYEYLKLIYSIKIKPKRLR